MAKSLSNKKSGNIVKETKQPIAFPTALTDIVQDKAIKAKEKTTHISQLLLNKTVTIDELVETAKAQTDASKAILIKAIEYTSKTNPEIINQKTFEFVVQSLKEDAPRVKWEAARVIANTADLFPKALKSAVTNLLVNTEHSGNVVRWSDARIVNHLSMVLSPTETLLILRVIVKENLSSTETTEAIEHVKKEIQDQFPNFRQVYVEPVAAA